MQSAGRQFMANGISFGYNGWGDGANGSYMNFGADFHGNDFSLLSYEIGYAGGVVARNLTAVMGGVGGAAVGGLSLAGEETEYALNGISNTVPDVVARVVTDNPITRASTTLGRPGAEDVFVTAADDIRGMNASQIADRLTIPESPTGYRVTEFSTPRSGIASPISRSDPGFIGGGKTIGGAREFVIPNGAIPVGSDVRLVL